MKLRDKKIEDLYVIRPECQADFLLTVVEEFYKGEIPPEEFAIIVAETALQMREDAEDRRENRRRKLYGKSLLRMTYRNWDRYMK